MTDAVELAVWLISEGSGTLIADTSGNGNNMTLSLNGSAAWGSDAAGAFVDFTDPPRTDNSAVILIPDITTTTIAAELEGVTGASFIIVGDVDAGNGGFGGVRLLNFGNGSNEGILSVIVRTDGGIRVGWSVGNYVDFPDITGVKRVITCVVDTTQAVASDRMVVKYDDVVQTPSGLIPQNANLTGINSSLVSASIGNASTLNRNIDGRVRAVFLYKHQLSDAQITTAVAALPANDDADWNVNFPPVLDTPIPPVSDVQGVPGTLDISVNYSDPNGNTLTFTESPALPSGYVLSSAGVVTRDGTAVIQAATSHTITADDGNGGTNTDGILSIEVTTAVPSITDIDTDNDIYPGQTAVNITTSNFGSSPAVTSATLGGEALTITSWNSGQPIVDVPANINLEYEQNYDLVLTGDADTATLVGVTLSIIPGYTQIVFNGDLPPIGTTRSYGGLSASDSETGNFAPAVDDILIYQDATGLSVDAQLLPTVSPAATVAGVYYFRDDSLQVYTPVSSYEWVDGGPPTVGNVSPTIDINPSDKTILESSSGSIVFVSAASGTPTPTAQWRKDVGGNGVYSDIVGETSSSIEILGVDVSNAVDDGTNYFCKYDNTEGSASTTSAKLFVAAATSQAPVFTSMIPNQTGPAGSLALLNVSGFVENSPTSYSLNQVAIDAGLSISIGGIISGNLPLTTQTISGVVVTAENLAGPGSSNAFDWVVTASAGTEIANITNVTTISGTFVSRTYEKWYLTDSDINNTNISGGTINIVASGANLQIINGSGMASVPGATPGASYTLVAWNDGTPANASPFYFRDVSVTVVAGS